MTTKRRRHCFSRILCGLVSLAAPFCARAQTPTIEPQPTQPVSTSCAPVLDFGSNIRTPSYDPFAISPLIHDSDISFQNSNCDQSITMTTAIGWGGLVPRLSYGGADLAFSFYVAGQNLTSRDGGLSSADQASAGASIILPRETTGILPNLVRIVIEPGQVVPPGTYVIEAPVNTQIAQDLLTRDLSLEPESRFESGSDVIRITTDVLAVMKIGVAGCDVSSSNSNASSQGYQDPNDSLASSCRLTLGDPQVGMINGDIARARLTSLTNINFVLAMTSRNGGVLRPVGRSADTKETEQVGYSASVQSQGQEFAFKCTGTLCGRSNVFEPSSSPLGTDIFFQVRVDEPELAQKRAGYYSDIITLIIQPAS